jgi:AbrB family looped-hinge helix DNA binding protein
MEKTIIQSVSKSSAGLQIYIPKKDAEELGIKAGDMLEFQLIKIIK